MKIIIEMKFCSVSVLQRKLGVSFARADFVASILEEHGYVSMKGNYRMLEVTDKGLAVNNSNESLYLLIKISNGKIYLFVLIRRWTWA